MQPYGINVVGDILALPLIVLFYHLASMVGPNPARYCLIVMSAVSASGSLSLLPTAVNRGDTDVFAYHAAWVCVSIAVTWWAVRKIRATNAQDRVEAAEYWANNTETFHSGMVYKSRPAGPDDTGVPVYRVTNL